MAYAASFRELEVYVASRRLRNRIFELSKKFPKEEKYFLIDQDGDPRDLSEHKLPGHWAKRTYEKHFVSKLTDSDGE